MEFDKSRVYSAVNADELKPGDKVIVADQLSVLKQRVQEGKEDSAIVLQEINGEDWGRRFGFKMSDYALAYLVERAKNCTNCGEGKWDAEHKKILCDPAYCGKGNVVFRNHEIEVCEYWKPKTKCTDCAKSKSGGRGTCVLEEGYGCDCYTPKTEPHYRPFKDTDELIRVWEQKWSEKTNGQKWHDCKLNMPLIWVRSKFNKDHKGVLINNYFGEYVELGKVQCFLKRLFEEYTFLDGSPCGVEE